MQERTYRETQDAGHDPGMDRIVPLAEYRRRRAAATIVPWEADPGEGGGGDAA